MSVRDLINTNKNLKFTYHAMYQSNKILEEQNSRLKESIIHSTNILQSSQNDKTPQNVKEFIQSAINNMPKQLELINKIKQTVREQEESAQQSHLINLQEIQTSLEKREKELKSNIENMNTESERSIFKTKVLQNKSDQLNQYLVKRTGRSEHANKLRTAQLAQQNAELTIQNQQLLQQLDLQKIDTNSYSNDEIIAKLKEMDELRAKFDNFKKQLDCLLEAEQLFLKDGDKEKISSMLGKYNQIKEDPVIIKNIQSWQQLAQKMNIMVDENVLLNLDNYDHVLNDKIQDVEEIILLTQKVKQLQAKITIKTNEINQSEKVIQQLQHQ